MTKVTIKRIHAMKLMSLAMRPVSLPPFPLEKIEEITRLMGGNGTLEY